MAKVYLVRHGKTGVPWDPEQNASLNDVGVTQATELAKTLSNIEPLPIISSPYLRTKQTAKPLELEWGKTASLSDAVKEIPSPKPMTSNASEWLTWALKSNWSDHGVETDLWKKASYDFIKNQKQDCLIFTHYLTITAIISEITGDVKTDCFSPPNCSLTLIETNGEITEFKGLVTPDSLA